MTARMLLRSPSWGTRSVTTARGRNGESDQAADLEGLDDVAACGVPVCALVF